MADKPQTSSGEHACMICGAKSDKRVLIYAEKNGKPAWVCAPCMPVLVHGED